MHSHCGRDAPIRQKLRILGIHATSCSFGVIPINTGNFLAFQAFQAQISVQINQKHSSELIMKNKQFWTGVAAGAAATVGTAWALRLSGRSRIIRLEKSVQIGRSVEDVFQSWCELESLPRFTSLLRSVRRFGDRSHWIAEVGGQSVEWDAEVVQVLPNQAIGWRSSAGSQHTGRITFAPIGDQTLVHVQMNYAPRPWLLLPVFATLAGSIEGYIEQALRDVKSALESRRGGIAGTTEAREPSVATGT
jgi:uncharacterized membrane protein